MPRIFACAAALAAIAAIIPAAQASEPTTELAVPGSCYTHATRKSDAKRLFDRVELQEVQHRTADGKPVGTVRFHLGIQPKGGDDLIPSDVSLPCVPQGKALVCTLQCDVANATTNGRFRVEPAGKTGRKLTLETEIVLNACVQGEQPVTLPKSLEGKTFQLKRSGTSDCFH